MTGLLIDCPPVLKYKFLKKIVAMKCLSDKSSATDVQTWKHQDSMSSQADWQSRFIMQMASLTV